jgi:hypothetical protein
LLEETDWVLKGTIAYIQGWIRAVQARRSREVRAQEQSTIISQMRQTLRQFLTTKLKKNVCVYRGIIKVNQVVQTISLRDDISFCHIKEQSSLVIVINELFYFILIIVR